jgi:DNA-nicking Smr family endonuclease
VKRPTPPAPEDTALFREAVQDVRPLRSKAAPRRPRPPPPEARFTRAERAAVLEESLKDDANDPLLGGGESLAFRRPGVPDTVFRKLRRGQYRLEGEIDLHGLNVAQAKAALREFLAEAAFFGARCVRVVHGKGLGSGPRGPVLKRTVDGILKRTDAVIAFCSARRVDGGTGAVYVLLSKTAA